MVKNNVVFKTPPSPGFSLHGPASTFHSLWIVKACVWMLQNERHFRFPFRSPTPAPDPPHSTGVRDDFHFKKKIFFYDANQSSAIQPETSARYNFSVTCELRCAKLVQKLGVLAVRRTCGPKSKRVDTDEYEILPKTCTEIDLPAVVASTN